MAEAALTFLLVLSVAYGGQQVTSGFIKEETIDLHADRVQDLTTSLDNIHEGHTEFEMENYEVKTEGMTFSLRYQDVVETRTIESETSYQDLEGPTEYEEIDTACIGKQQNQGSTLVIEEC